MTEYHHLINRQAYGLFQHSSLWDKMSVVNPVTCLLFFSFFYFFEALNDVLEVLFFQDFIFNLIKHTGSMQNHAADIFKVETVLNKCL